MNQERTEAAFFRGKRPWSRIKDQILEQYMPAYFAKVAKLRRPIVLIDAFAGPGKFEDGSEGSPLIICRAAERSVSNRYLAFFVNHRGDHHARLSRALSDLVDPRKVVAIHGTAGALLAQVQDVLADHTVFLYLDPFGLKGCEFATIEPFLRRDKSFSTEIVITLSIPTMHRLAARKAVAEGRGSDRKIRAFHDRLTAVLGGEYWKDILWDDGTTAESKAEAVMELYRGKIVRLEEPRGFSGSCPVRERRGSGIKYYVTFYSRHRDAMLLMNDAMCSAYQSRMHEAATDGTLFERTNWKETRDTGDLERAVLRLVGTTPGKSRLDLWVEIVQGHFMQFTAAEYRAAIQKLVRDKKLDFEDVKRTRRLNDESRLHLPGYASP